MFAVICALAVMQGTRQTPPPQLRYRVEEKKTVDQDLTSRGRGKLTGSLSTTAFISVGVTDSAAGQVVRAVVDSMQLEATGAMAVQLTPAAAKAAADSARGAWVHAYSVSGTIRGVPQPSVQNPALATVMQAVQVMFPGLRSGIKLGDTWADTTKIDGDVQGGHQVGSIIATWNVTSMDNGLPVLDGTSVTKVLTSGQPGQSVSVTGSSRSHFVMAPRGSVRSATIESTREASSVQKEGDTPVPSKTIAVLRLVPLP